MSKKDKVIADEKLKNTSEQGLQELGKAAEETTAEVEATLDLEETEEVTEMDWKTASRKLKSVVDDINSIDNYFRKPEIEKLRSRYNAKDRSEELYSAIMKL